MSSDNSSFRISLSVLSDRVLSSTSGSGAWAMEDIVTFVDGGVRSADRGPRGYLDGYFVWIRQYLCRVGDVSDPSKVLASDINC
jgi:hypothetical protein